jgi:hypothetical protein
MDLVVNGLSATESLQRSVLHMLLRHRLSHLFANPVNLEQFEMQWSRKSSSQSLSWFGKLSDLELNSEYLSSCTVWPSRLHVHH